MSSQRKPGIHVAWKTVTYRSVLLVVLAGVTVFSIGLHFAFPEFTEGKVKAVSNVFGKLLDQVVCAWRGRDVEHRPISRVSYITSHSSE